MIQLTAQMRLLVAVEPVDFRRGIDGLGAVCRQVLGEEPLSGAVFVFRNRAATSVKALVYDGQGYWLCQKRLSVGRFRHWPEAGSGVQRELLAHELQVLFAGGDPHGACAAPEWRRVRPTGRESRAA